MSDDAIVPLSESASEITALTRQLEDAVLIQHYLVYYFMYGKQGLLPRLIADNRPDLLPQLKQALEFCDAEFDTMMLKWVESKQDAYGR